MVAPKQKEVLRVPDFKGEEKDDGFDGLFASIYIISEEEIVLGRWVASVIKYFQQVLELPVDITHYFYWRLQLQQGRLLQEYLTRHLANSFYFILAQFYIFSWSLLH